MTTMNISLPDSQAEFVKKCVETQGYQTVSEFFRTLVRTEQKRQAEAVINELLLAELNAPTSPVTDEDWAILRDKLLQVRESRTTK